MNNYCFCFEDDIIGVGSSWYVRNQAEAIDRAMRGESFSSTEEEKTDDDVQYMPCVKCSLYSKNVTYSYSKVNPLYCLSCIGVHKENCSMQSIKFSSPKMHL
jgi:hypothetical protein